MEYKTLWKGKWTSVVTPLDVYHETQLSTSGIWVIPIIKTKKSTYVGIRYEDVVPYWLTKNQRENYYTVISGQLDHPQNSNFDTLKRELIEECGVDIKEYNILDKYINTPIGKGSTYRSDIYFIEITKFDRVKAVGDGTIEEKNSKTVWVTLPRLEQILRGDKWDFSIFAIYNYLKGIL